MINISPGQKEITYLKEQFGEKDDEKELKKYAARVMDAYARNFKSPGIENGKDLLWYGKLERYRYHHHTDEEVKQGIAQVGQSKEEEQMHVQIIVSRKDMTNKINLYRSRLFAIFETHQTKSGIEHNFLRAYSEALSPQLL